MFIERPQYNNNNTLDPCVQFDYLAWTLTASLLYTLDACFEFLISPSFHFPCACGLLRCTPAFVWVLKMQVKFPQSPPTTPSLCCIHYLIPPFAAKLWSVFALWLAARCSPFPSQHLPLLLLFNLSPLCSPLHSFWFLLLVFLCLSLPFLPTLFLFLPFPSSFFPPSFLSFSASELKMDLNGWGHGGLSTLWSYGCYRLC